MRSTLHPAFFIRLTHSLCSLNPSLEDHLFTLLFRTCLKCALFMCYSCKLLEISVQISFIGNPRDCSRILGTWTLHSIIFWRADLLCLLRGEGGMWGLTVSCNFQEHSCLWKRLRSLFICHLTHVLQPGWWSPQLDLTHIVLRTYSDPDWPGLCWRHGRVVAIKKKKSSFLLNRHGKSSVENVPNLTTHTQIAKGMSMVAKGRLGGNLGAQSAFLSVFSLLISLRALKLPCLGESDPCRGL